MDPYGFKGDGKKYLLIATADMLMQVLREYRNVGLMKDQQMQSHK